ncbi:Hsp33 family molecular chaperone HslO, partial [Lysobacter sp. 2RAB21]
SLGREEADAAAAEGEAHIRCEFCGQSYRFDRNQIAGLFAAAAAEIQAPQRVQ